MYFYLLIVPVLVMSARMAIYLHGLKKHDLVLYNFCQIRRDAMALLRDEDINLSREDYIVLRKLVHCLNIAIANYKDHRTALFNLRRFSAHLQQFKSSKKKVEKVKRTNNKQITEIYEKFQNALWQGFFAYTPLLKSELIIKLILSTSKILANLGIDYVNKYTRRLSEAAGLVKEHRQKLSSCH